MTLTFELMREMIKVHTYPHQSLGLYVKRFSHGNTDRHTDMTDFTPLTADTGRNKDCSCVCTSLVSFTRLLQIWGTP